MVIRIARLPLGSSRASALAQRSCSLPSAGWVRDAYPDIHIGLSGVIVTAAAPAFQAFGSAAVSPQADASNTTQHQQARNMRFPSASDWRAAGLAPAVGKGPDGGDKPRRSQGFGEPPGLSRRDKP